MSLPALLEAAMKSESQLRRAAREDSRAGRACAWRACRRRVVGGMLTV